MLERRIEEKLGLYAKSSFFTCDAGCARLRLSESGLVVHAPAFAIAEGLMEQGGR